MKTLTKLFFVAAVATAFAACNSYGGPGNDMGNYISSKKYKDYGENPFIGTGTQAVSTFSVDADGGAYGNMRRFLYLGQTPPVASVRVEEYLNYFTFDYPEPKAGENVGLNSEISTCPWNPAHYLIRIGMKGKTIPEAELPAANYVFLIDVSGSMNSPDKLGILKTGFKMLVDNLRDNDRVAIVTYASGVNILLKSTNADEKAKIKSAIDKLSAGGSTAGAAALSTAYDVAVENLIANGNNRVIIGTDGDFNVGPSSDGAMTELIKGKLKTGIYLTVLGVGDGNLNESMMEQIAGKGNGNYEYIDNADQLLKVFVNEKAKFYTVAKDSKIQITFNTNKVDSFRLIGYENRAMSQKEFKNDSTDAGEIGSSQTITALYEVVLNGTKNIEKYAQFDFKYKKPNETKSRSLQHIIINSPVDISVASVNMRFAASVTALGLIMKQSVYKGKANKQMVLSLAGNVTSFDPHDYRKEFISLLNKWKE